jgi:catalase
VPNDPRVVVRERSLTPGATLARLAAIGIMLLVVAGLFAYTGGWLSPHRLTPSLLMGAFEGDNGPHPGFRRNHAKGMCVSGWFQSSGAALSLANAQVFQPGRVPVVGRFALAGGMPAQPDAPATVRSMALRFLPPGGGEWRTGMNNIPVFPVNSAQSFYDQLVAGKPDPATGKPNPAALQQFLARHPETARALALIKQRSVSSGFGDSTYNSLDAFRFISSSGVATPVRWAMAPSQPVVAEAPAQAADANKNYLFDEFAAQVRQHALQWHLLVTLGQPGDPTDDATLPWPEDRKRVDAGTLTIDRVSSEDGGACTDINYDPLVLPPGIEPSDDPLLSARSAAYSRSFTLRAGEKSRKPPSAVTPRELGAGDRS